MLKRLAKSTRAATAVEYGLILGFVVIAMFVGLAQLGSATSGLWNNVATRVNNSS